MNQGSLLSYKQFKHDLKDFEQQLFRKLIEEHKDNISVSPKTAYKNLGTLFHATLKITNKKGFAAMSLRDLSKETNMSLGSIYTYIKAKEDLLSMIQTHHINLAEQVFKTVLAKPNDAKQQITQALKAHLYLSQAMSDWFYFSFTETKHLSRKVIEQSKQSELKSEKLFIDIIESGINSGEFKAVNPLLMASVIKALLQDWYLKPWKYKSRKITLDYYLTYVQTVIKDHLYLA